MPKVSNASIEATLKTASFATITQQDLAEYETLYNKFDEAHKVIKAVEKRCKQIMAITTGLSEDGWKKKSPQELAMLVNQRLNQQALFVEPGKLDFEIKPTSDRVCPSWKEAFITEAGEEKAAMVEKNTPHSYGYDVVPVVVSVKKKAA